MNDLLAYQNKDLTFSKLEYSRESVLLVGRSRTREAFLDLNAKIKEDANFEEVTSPISSLIATSSLNFSIRMKVKQGK